MTLGALLPDHITGVPVCGTTFCLSQSTWVVAIFRAQLALLNAVHDPLRTDHLDTGVPLAPLALGLSEEELVRVRVVCCGGMRVVCCVGSEGFVSCGE